MTKNETKVLLNKIKGYYNSQFFVDEFVIEAWSETMKPYELEDAISHIQDWVKEYPDMTPKPQTFKKGLYTIEEKKRYKDSDYTIACNLCHKWMSLSEYDAHYDKCLTIEYLVNTAKAKGESITRKEIENCRQEVIDKLYKKYPPEAMTLKKAVDEIT